MQLIKMLNRRVNTKPDTIQFTKDRKFEEAWIISSKTEFVTEHDIAKYLEIPFSLLIVEYIWNSDDDDNRFVLTVLLKNIQTDLTDSQKISTCLELFYNWSTFGNFVNLFDDRIIGKSYLFRHGVNQVDIGIFNHWLSVGPECLWKSGDALDLSAIESKIRSRPELLVSELNYQCMFFKYNSIESDSEVFYGLKTPTCSKQANNWVVDFEKINFWLTAIIGK